MARTPSSRGHGTEEKLEELNLAPIMAILVILIPMIIYAFNFVEITVLRVSAPKMGKPKEVQEQTKKPLNLTVLVTPDGFTIKQEEELTTEPDKPIPKTSFVDAQGNQVTEYNYPALYSKLVEKKRLHKEETTINIGADPQVKWGIVARTIDTSRVELEDPAYTDFDAWSKAKPKKSTEGAVVELFPDVVFTVAE
jgi:biopolymer transport protein ExbD